MASAVAERCEYNVDRHLEKLAADGVVITVLEIGHYRQPVQSSIRCSDVFHHFLRLRLRVEDQEEHIKAEKFLGRIEISKVEGLETNGAEIMHGPVGVEDCVRLRFLLAILKEEHSPDDNLLSDNCSKYAESTFRRLSRNFSPHPTISPERRSEREGFLNHPAPTMPDNVNVPYDSVSSGGAGEGAAAPLPRPGVHPGGAGIFDTLVAICDYFRVACEVDRNNSEVDRNISETNRNTSETVRNAFEVARVASEHFFGTRPLGGMHTIPRMQAPAAARYQNLSAPQTIQFMAAAQSLAQTMRRA
ncbi:unnamed protein product [Sphagnum balticum]